ncbi:MAG: threonine/serine exporter family protein [Firmicutes bacterium]|nr:threonine/serine exporter family protein [Bacillota bacterium]
MEEKRQQKRILVLAVRAGEIMMKAGAEIYRVEDTITRICKSCGINYVDVFAMPTGIFITMDKGFEEDDTYTYICRIKSSSTDLNKISRVNEFSRQFATTDMTVEEGMKILDEIEQEKTYPLPVRIVCASLAAACFSVLFGGNAMDFAITFLIGAVCYAFSRFLTHAEVNFFIHGLCCCALAAFIALIAAASIDGTHYAMIIAGCLMLFVPGVAITNSIRDFLSGDMVSGLGRMAEAFLTAVSLAAGAGIVLKLWALIGGIVL